MARARFSDIQRVGPGFINERNAAVKAARGIRIDTTNLRAFRRDLRDADKKIDRELVKEFRDIGRRVASEGSRLAPHRSGALAGSIRPSVALRGVAVGSRKPYANVRHWGGTTGRGHKPGVPWSGSVRVQPSLFLSRAVEHQEDRIVDDVGDAIERAATRHMGWR